jgi:hypothetical protein
MDLSRYTETQLVELLLRDAKWKGQDAYPATQDFLLELDNLLGFLKLQNRLDAFWPRLSDSRPAERDDALQEIRVARFFAANAFPVVQWEPAGNGKYIGEFSIQGAQSEPIFVEIKSPGWEGQLSQAERDAGRTKQPKYEDLRGGPDDPWRGIRASVKKAYPKFSPSQSNLLVIADDRFTPLATWGRLGAEQALLIKNNQLDGEPGYFTSSAFENLGGVALFKAEDEVLEGLHYTLILFPNPMALRGAALPKSFVETFLKVRAAAASM